MWQALPRPPPSVRGCLGLRCRLALVWAHFFLSATSVVRSVRQRVPYGRASDALFGHSADAQCRAAGHCLQSGSTGRQIAFEISMRAKWALRLSTP